MRTDEFIVLVNSNISFQLYFINEYKRLHKDAILLNISWQVSDVMSRVGSFLDIIDDHIEDKLNRNSRNNVWSPWKYDKNRFSEKQLEDAWKLL